MDTYRLFEQFKTVMDESAAKILVGALGDVYQELSSRWVTKEDFRELRDVVAELAQAQKQTGERIDQLTQAQKRTEEAQNRTEVRVNQLVEAQRRTEDRMNELAHAQERTHERMNELAHAQERTHERMNELAHAQERTEGRMEQLAQAQQRTEEILQRLIQQVAVHEVRLAKLDGRTLESQFREKAASYLGLVLRGTRVISPAELADDLENVLTEAEWAELLRLDVLARGRAVIQGQRLEVFVAVEVSVKVAEEDVVRVARRAGLLRKKGWKTLAVAAGEEAADPLISLAAAQGVAILRDGQQFNWDQAIAAA